MQFSFSPSPQCCAFTQCSTLTPVCEHHPRLPNIAHRGEQYECFLGSLADGDQYSLRMRTHVQELAPDAKSFGSTGNMDRALEKQIASLQTRAEFQDKLRSR